MFKTEDMLARLREGASVDDIAKEMTEALNSASKAYDKEKADKEAAKVKAAKLKEATVDIVYCIYDFLAEYYPDLIEKFIKIFEIKEDETLENVAGEAADEVIDTLNYLDKNLDKWDLFIKPNKIKFESNFNNINKHDDKIFDELLNHFHLW